jgi:hypothetical protein
LRSSGHAWWTRTTRRFQWFSKAFGISQIKEMQWATMHEDKAVL